MAKEDRSPIVVWRLRVCVIEAAVVVVRELGLPSTSGGYLRIRSVVTVKVTWHPWRTSTVDRPEWTQRQANNLVQKKAQHCWAFLCLVFSPF